MKKRNNNIFLFVSAFLLSAALLLPSTVQLAHIFEGHEHKVCSEITTHFHEKQVDCPIDHFNFSFFNLQFNPVAIATPGVQFKKKVFYYKDHLVISDERFLQLRGPPINTV